jgi:hypothetical protein
MHKQTIHVVECIYLLYAILAYVNMAISTREKYNQNTGLVSWVQLHVTHGNVRRYTDLRFQSDKEFAVKAETYFPYASGRRQDAE